MSFQPPPKRASTPSTSSSTPATAPEATGWKAKMKARGATWGKVAMEKGVALSDNVGGKVNNIAEKKFGTEHFWPVTGDFGREMDKCARILRSFTVEGVINEEAVSPSGTSTPTTDAGGAKANKPKSKKVLRKIPPKVIANAKGLVIFTSMRTGFAPFGGAGGAGVVIAKLPDGTWSGPASISPNNLSAGFLIGVDVYDAVLVVNSQKALDSFKTHKATLGAEIGVAAGPYGSGASVEAGLEKTPIWSYVKSKGMYAGVEVVGQVFVERFDENAAMYHWPGVKAGDILAGKVKVPREAAALISAISDAETGRAQAADPTKPDGAEVIQNQAGEMIIPDAGGVVLEEGEVMHLPPTPSMMVGDQAGIGGMGAKQAEAMEGRRGSGSGVGGEGYAPTPTATPPRLPSRPVINKHYSSASNYDDSPDNTTDTTTKPFADTHAAIPQPVSSPSVPHDQVNILPPPIHPNDLPPAYPDDTPQYTAPPPAHSTVSGYPDEKAELKRRDELEAQTQNSAGTSGAGQEMSESERREWAEAEEMIRLEKEEMERLAATSGTGVGQGSSSGTGDLTGGVAGMRLGEREV